MFKKIALDFSLLFRAKAKAWQLWIEIHRRWAADEPFFGFPSPCLGLFRCQSLLLAVLTQLSKCKLLEIFTVSFDHRCCSEWTLALAGKTNPMTKIKIKAWFGYFVSSFPSHQNFIPFSLCHSMAATFKASVRPSALSPMSPIPVWRVSHVHLADLSCPIWLNRPW